MSVCMCILITESQLPLLYMKVSILESYMRVYIRVYIYIYIYIYQNTQS